jgi:hypothetical protein
VTLAPAIGAPAATATAETSSGLAYIVISAEKTRIFLYTGRAGAAREAELAARQVLAQQGLSADVRLDR